MGRKLTTEEANKRILEIHGETIMLAEPYKGSNKQHTFKCNKKHTWKTTPDNIFRGTKCPHCSSRKRTQEEAESDILEVHGNIKLISTYVNRHSKHLFHCDICSHEWEAEYGQVVRGSGCPVCAGKIFNTVYMWRVPSTNIYKIGVSTTQLVKSRIKRVASGQNITEPEIILIRNTEAAKEIESSILYNYVEFRHKLDGDGGTEFLLLDENMAQEVKSLIQVL
ncbi:hypothetical protein F404_gp136 [Vibrio phage pVp-1]|uniref:Treble clef zinc finger domain-containing protein n=1 Tax=Vibrio phage pVp-1 TaxID=1150989 RepID=H6WXM7_9CAUD|nr:hypothetical protein F404_gp136 [Vibrio phage pVp-1]AFB83993.1 hypothetical protein pVp-1_0136 [Vibrio phage pVp-1]